MPEYRIHTVGSDGHFFEAKHVECADNSEAIRIAQQAVDGRAIELWERARFITRLGPKSASK